MKHHYYKKQGFTLAEVLITLGIIGVVAALTLTTVIPEIQNKQNIAKWKKEYSVVNTAFNEVVADGTIICSTYGVGNGFCNGGYSDEFVDAIQQKLRVIDYCGSDSKVDSNHQCDYYLQDYWTKNAKYKWSCMRGRFKALGGSKQGLVNSYNFGRIALLLNDGATVYLGELWEGPWILVDVNNCTQGPNEFGRDVFVINVSSNIKQDRHYLVPAGSSILYHQRSALNNPSYGITGCSKDIGSQSSNTVYEVAGSGCSAKYLME